MQTKFVSTCIAEIHTNKHTVAGQKQRESWKYWRTGKKHKWQFSEECMCRLRNIALRDYQESVTTVQTYAGQTDAGQQDPYVPLHVCCAGDTTTLQYDIWRQANTTWSANDRFQSSPRWRIEIVTTKLFTPKSAYWLASRKCRKTYVVTTFTPGSDLIV